MTRWKWPMMKVNYSVITMHDVPVVASVAAKVFLFVLASKLRWWLAEGEWAAGWGGGWFGRGEWVVRLLFSHLWEVRAVCRFVFVLYVWVSFSFLNTVCERGKAVGESLTGFIFFFFFLNLYECSCVYSVQSVCVYVCASTHMHASCLMICVCVCTRVCVCVPVHDVCVHLCLCVDVCVYESLWACIHACMRVHIIDSLQTRQNSVQWWCRRQYLALLVL